MLPIFDADIFYKDNDILKWAWNHMAINRQGINSICDHPDREVDNPWINFDTQDDNSRSIYY